MVAKLATAPATAPPPDSRSPPTSSPTMSTKTPAHSPSATPAATAAVPRNTFEFRPVSRTGSDLPGGQEVESLSLGSFSGSSHLPKSHSGVSGYISESKDSSTSRSIAVSGASLQEAMMMNQLTSETCSMASFSRSSTCGGRSSELLKGLPQVPSCFRCPVTQRLMEDPVRLDNGKICDRASLATLGYKGPVVPDASLKAAIAGYIELQKDAAHRDEEWKALLARKEEKYNTRLNLRQRQVYGLRLLLEKSRQSLRDLNGQRESGSSSCGSTEAGSAEEVPSVESPLSVPVTATANLATAGPVVPEDPQFKCGPVLRVQGAEKHRPPSRKSTWAGLFHGGK
mmetsp:Transcript_38377/g.81345  ORF Transcript_38377/g.81345 Transcript_38377/m.81345 type:complete len:341 (+) Transcript_38377:83-1105(+)